MKKNKSKVYRCAECNYIFSHVSERYSDVQCSCPRCNVYGAKRCLEIQALELAMEQREHQPVIKTRVYTFNGYDGLMRARFESEENIAMFVRHAHSLFDTNPVVPGEVWLTPCATQANTWDVTFDSPTNAGKQLKNFASFSEDSAVHTTLYGHYLDMTEEMLNITQPLPDAGLNVVRSPYPLAQYPVTEKRVEVSLNLKPRNSIAR